MEVFDLAVDKKALHVPCLRKHCFVLAVQFEAKVELVPKRPELITNRVDEGKTLVVAKFVPKHHSKSHTSQWDKPLH